MVLIIQGQGQGQGHGHGQGQGHGQSQSQGQGHGQYKFSLLFLILEIILSAMGLQISNDATHGTIVISDSAGVSPTTYINKSDIARIDSFFMKNSLNGLGQTPYAYGVRTPGRTTKTIVKIEYVDKTTFSFDCDEVLNQTGWHGCTLAALNQATSDINSWL